MMDQIRQSVFIKEECDIDWDEEDNAYGAINDLELDKIKIEVDSLSHEIISEIIGISGPIKLEKIKVEAESPSKYIPPEIDDTRQLNELEKTKLAEECLSYNYSVIINPLMRCPKCGVHTKNFHNHYSSCEKKDYIYCVYCPYKVNTMNTRKRCRLLLNHIRHAHLEKKPIACHKCGSLVKSWYLSYHLKICGGQSEDHFCRHCSFQTKHLTSLRRHIKYLHSGGGSTSCPECNKRLTSQGKLNRHLFYCKNKPQLCCQICNFTTNKRKIFMKHVVTTHFS